MASLTGQQIQNSYEGLLKTENNAALPGGQTWITDGVGNRTGLFFWKDYATMGVSNNGTPAVSPFIDSQNTNFNVANSPMGASGNNNLIFSDVNGNRTWGVIQNRFGGTQYDIAKAGQSHYFTNSGDGNAVIRVNTFNNVNNSDNWYLGYQKSADSLSYNSGTGDLTLGRTDDTDLVVNIPSGGGGGSYSYKADQYYTPGAYDAGIGSAYGFFTNVCIFHPIFLPSGTLSEVAIQVELLSATANDTRLVLYTAGSTSSTKHPYGTPSQLVGDFGIVDTSVSGLIQISTNITIPEGLYYYGVYQEGPFDAAFRVYDYSTSIVGRGINGRVVSSDTANLTATSTSYPAWYSTFGAGWTPPATLTNAFSNSSDKLSMYFKMS